VTNVLIDIVLVGIVAFVVRKRARGRRVTPASPTPARFVPREPAPALAEASTPVTTTSRPETGAASRAYLLGGRPAAGRSDRMAEAMAMMSGPGICTPPLRRPRQADILQP
jgi:hypothetical protein